LLLLLFFLKHAHSLRTKGREREESKYMGRGFLMLW
jgi:hypothetical protein